MATIGTFKKTGSDYTGEIAMLAMERSNVRIVPEANRSGDTAPTHRVFAGKADIGAGWTQTSREGGREYLSIKLDDPSFTAPVYCNLFADESGQTHNLIWSRSRKPD